MIRVEQGQVLAEIDPVPYHDEVELARSKVAGAEAELKRQEAALARLRLEVPIQIEIARRTLAAAKADEVRAQEALKLTADEVEHGIEEAQAGAGSRDGRPGPGTARVPRFTSLQKEDAVPLRRAQEVTQARDAAEAHRKLAATKLAQAEADRTQIEVAKADSGSGREDDPEGDERGRSGRDRQRRNPRGRIADRGQEGGRGRSSPRAGLGRGPAQIHADSRALSRASSSSAIATSAISPRRACRS